MKSDHEHITPLHSSAKKNLIVGMEDIMEEAKALTGLPGQGNLDRQFVLMVFTSKEDKSIKIKDNLAVLLEGG